MSAIETAGRALDQITLKMTSSLELKEVLTAVTEGLASELDAAAAHIWLVDEDGSGLELGAAAGLPPEPVEQASAKVRWVVESGDHFCTNELPTDGSVGPPAWILENGLRATATLPLSFRQEQLGALVLYQRRRVSDEEFERLFLFAREAAVAIQNARLFEQVEQLKDRLEAENQYLQQEVENEHNCGDLVGKSPAIRAVMRQVEQVATTDSTVLIQGETGTGKELVALAIHKRSRRRDRPMVKVNCGAISAGLTESELFGHEKGAFTGALERRIGRFELADGGTLFLDEIGELPMETQVRLLRVLQEQEFERVGNSQPIRVNVRVIAAGNRDLEAEVAAGRFRADLFYRLNVFPIQVPPLRQRKDDIPLIAYCVLGRIAERLGKPLTGLSPRALQHLEAYGWPGNVRELLNVLERAAILSTGQEVDLPDPLGRGPSAPLAESADGELLPLAELERRHIQRVLEHTDWVIEGPRGAAGILELHPNTLRSRLSKLGLKRP